MNHSSRSRISLPALALALGLASIALFAPQPTLAQTPDSIVITGFPGSQKFNFGDSTRKRKFLELSYTVHLSDNFGAITTATATAVTYAFSPVTEPPLVIEDLGNEGRQWEFRITSPITDTGVYTYTVTATATAEGYDDNTATLTVNVREPEATISNVDLDTGTTFDFGLTPYTVNFDILPVDGTFTATSANNAFTIAKFDDEGSERSFTVTPPEVDDGDGPYTDTITITARNQDGRGVTRALTYTLTPAPITLSGVPSGTDLMLTYANTASTFTLSAFPTDATVEVSTPDDAVTTATVTPVMGTAGDHTLMITPPNSVTGLGDTVVTITVTDPDGGRTQVTQEIMFTVVPRPAATFTGLDADGITDAFDFGNDARTISFTVAPATVPVTISPTSSTLFTNAWGLTGSDGSYTFTIQPPASDDPNVGSYSETLIVTADEDGRTPATQALTFTVNQQFTLPDLENILIRPPVSDFGGGRTRIDFGVLTFFATNAFTAEAVSTNALFASVETVVTLEPDSRRSLIVYAYPLASDPGLGTYIDTIKVTVSAPGYQSSVGTYTRRFRDSRVITLDGVPATGAALEYGAAPSTYMLTVTPTDATVEAQIITRGGAVTAEVVATGTAGEHTLTITPPIEGPNLDDTKVRINARHFQISEGFFSEVLTYTVVPREAATFVGLDVVGVTDNFNFGDDPRAIDFTVDPAMPTTAVTVSLTTYTLFNPWSIRAPTDDNPGGAYTLTIQPPATDPGTGGTYTETLTITATEDGRTPATRDLTFTVTSPSVPTVGITDSAAAATANSADGNLTFTLTWDEEVTGFEATDFSSGDITVTGGTAVTFTGTNPGMVYTLVVTPTPDTDAGTITVTVTANAVTSTANGMGNAELMVMKDYDTQAPTGLEFAIPSGDNEIDLAELVRLATTGSLSGVHFSGLVEEASELTILFNADTNCTAGGSTAVVIPTTRRGVGAWTYKLQDADFDALGQGGSAKLLCAIARDAAGNVVSVTRTVTVNTIVPVSVATDTIVGTDIYTAIDIYTGGERTDLLTYTLSGDDSSSFSLTPQNGVLSPVADLNTAATYNIDITADDAIGNSATYPLRVTVVPRPAATFTGLDADGITDAFDFGNDARTISFTVAPATVPVTISPTSSTLFTNAWGLTGSDGSYTFTIQPPASDDPNVGSYSETLIVTADEDGRTPATQALTFTVNQQFTLPDLENILIRPPVSDFGGGRTRIDFGVLTFFATNAFTAEAVSTNALFASVETVVTLEPDSRRSLIVYAYPLASDPGLGTYIDTIKVTVSAPGYQSSVGTYTRRFRDSRVITLDGVPATGAALEYGAAPSTYMLTVTPTDATVEAQIITRGGAVTAEVVATGTAGEHTLTITPPIEGPNLDDTKVRINARHFQISEGFFSEVLTYTVVPREAATFVGLDVVGVTDNFNFGDDPRAIDFTVDPAMPTTAVTVSLTTYTLFNPWSIRAPTDDNPGGAYTLTIQPPATDPGTGGTYTETLTITATEDGRTPASQQLTFTINTVPATLAYTGAFTEAAANDGSVEGSIIATLSGDTFATNAADHVTASNVPAGLTAEFALTSDTVVTLTLTGAATSHVDANDVTELTITFAAAAFAAGTAATDSTYAAGMIDFRDAPAPATLAYTGAFTEAAANDGSVEGSIIATLTGDTFATDVITGNHVSVTANLPAGLTAEFARTGDTVVTLTLTGAATSHVDANDVTELTITFAAAAFATGTAASGSTYEAGMIDFRDASTLAYTGTFTEAAANDGSVEGSIIATLTGDTFATDVITGNHVSVTSNLPAGLTAAFARTSDTVVTLTLTGAATSHVDANDVTELTITFAAAAFAAGTAATDSTYTTGMIDFRDAPAPATLAYAGTFTEAAANDGSVEGSITATLTGDTFAADVVSGNHVSVTANLPDGLTAEFARTSDTVVTLTLNAAADDHEIANNVSDLTITFVAAAFATGTAATDSTYTTGRIDFRDATPSATVSGLVAVDSALGGYALGETIPVTLTFSEAVAVTGTPQLALTFDGFDGEVATTSGQATYTAGSGSTALTFTYTVVEGNAAYVLDYAGTAALTLPDGAAIQNDAARTVAAILTLPAPTGLFGDPDEIYIDGIRPTVASITPNATRETITVTASEPVSGVGLGILDGTEFILNGTDSVVTAVTTGTAADPVVDLTLTLDQAIGLGGTVTLDWAPGTGDAIVDDIGNDMIAFDGLSVYASNVAELSFAETIDAQTYTFNTPIAAMTLPEATGGVGARAYTLAPLPSGLTFSTARVLSGTPDAAAAAALIYTVTDSGLPANMAALTFTVTVEKADQPALTFGVTDVEKVLGNPVFTEAATGGADTIEVTYFSGTPTVATVDRNSGAVAIVGAGTTIITATKAADANYNVITATYTLTVAPAPIADPLVVLADVGTGTLITDGTASVEYAGTSTYTFTADPDTATVNVASTGTGEVGASIAAAASGTAGEWTLTLTAPTSGIVLTDTVTITAVANGRTTTTVPITVTVTPRLAATFSGLSAIATSAYEFGDGARTFDFTVSPTVPVTISLTAGVLFTWSLTDNNGGSYTLTVQPLAADPAVGRYSETLTITAGEDGRLPAMQELMFTITPPSNTATLGALTFTLSGDVRTLNPAFDSAKTAYTATAPLGTTIVTVAATATDDDARVQYAVGANPADNAFADSGDLTVDSGDNVLTVRVTAEDATTTRDYTITLTVGLPFVADQNYTLNQAVALTLPEAIGTDAYAYTLTPIAGLTFDPGARTLSGTPTEEGVFNLTYTATDTSDATATAARSFTITISPATIERLNEQILTRTTQAIAANTLAAMGARVEAAAGGFGSFGGSGVVGNLGETPKMAYQFGGQSSLGGLLKSHGKAMLEGEMEVEKLLDGASFVMPLSAADSDDSRGGSTGLSLWGSSDYRSLADDTDDLDWDGKIISGHIGVDGPISEQMLAGIALSWNRGNFDYSEKDGGTVSTTGDYEYRATNLHPYIGWLPRDGLRLWGTAGYGVGEIKDERTVNDTPSESSADTEQTSLAGGFTGRVASSADLLSGGVTTLNLKGDISLVWVDVSEDGGENIVAQNIDTQRLRLLMLGEYERTLSAGELLVPSLEVGIRHDAGEEVDGDGIEVGTGLRYANPDRSLSISGNVRTLLSHEYDEWGADLSVRLSPSSGRGLSLSVSPVWGKTQSAAERLWDDGIDELIGGDTDLQRSLDTEIGYGMGAMMLGSPGILTPYAGMTTDSGGSERVRLGGRFLGGNGFSLNLESVRENGTAGGNHTVLLRGEIAF